MSNVPISAVPVTRYGPNSASLNWAALWAHFIEHEHAKALEIGPGDGEDKARKEFCVVAWPMVTISFRVSVKEWTLES